MCHAAGFFSVLSFRANQCSAFGSALIAHAFYVFACLLLIQLHSSCDYHKGADQIETFVHSFELDNNTVLRSTDLMRNAQSYSVEGSIIIIFESI